MIRLAERASKIKICGLTRLCDIEAVNEAMPDYVGFVFAESRRRVTPDQAAVLREKLSEDIIPVGVFVDEALEQILAFVNQGLISAIQLHGEEDEGYIATIKAKTSKPIIKAIPVTRIGDVQKWEDTCADYLLLDNKRGGTGEHFDWQHIGRTAKPFFLAGGLRLSNINAALDIAHPYAVDISSGVETDGFKDKEKITAMVRRVRDAR